MIGSMYALARVAITVGALMAGTFVAVKNTHGLHRVEYTANAAYSAAVDAWHLSAGDQGMVLPEDGQAYHTTIFTSHNWQTVPQEREFVAWFQTNPRLVSLTAQTKTHHYTNADRIWSRYQNSVGSQLPAVMVQSADGKVVFKASGQNVGQDPEELAASIGRCFPRPKPDDTHVPAPAQPVQPTMPTIPDIGPPPTDAANGDLTVALALFGVGGLIAFIIAWGRRTGGYGI